MCPYVCPYMCPYMCALISSCSRRLAPAPRYVSVCVPLCVSLYVCAYMCVLVCVPLYVCPDKAGMRGQAVLDDDAAVLCNDPGITNAACRLLVQPNTRIMARIHRHIVVHIYKGITNARASPAGHKNTCKRARNVRTHIQAHTYKGITNTACRLLVHKNIRVRAHMNAHTNKHTHSRASQTRRFACRYRPRVNTA